MNSIYISEAGREQVLALREIIFKK